jgi:DNA replication factor GINS
MDLNELQSVQSRERQTDSLQQLRASFYRDAADYIGDLEAERDSAAQRADDPWNSPEVGRLNDDIDTAKGTVEAIYERRVGKIVKMASLAAADMPTDDEGLTDEEQALFDQLVTAIEQNREGVFAILDGEDPAVDPTATPPVDTGAAAPATDGSPTATDASGPAAEATDSPADTVSTETASAEPAPENPGPAETASDAGGNRHEVPPDIRDPADGPPIDDSPTDDTPTDQSPKDDQSETDDQHVGAADLMGGDSGANDTGPMDTEPEPRSAESDGERSGQPVRDGGGVDSRAADSTSSPDGRQSPAETAPGPDATATDGPDTTTDDPAPSGRATNGAGEERTEGATTGEAGNRDPVTIDRSMVRITDDVGPIYGVEGREYDLTADDVVTLPEPNVGPLLEQGAAERLD